MKLYFLFYILVLFFFTSHAQDYDKLSSLQGSGVTTHLSKGHEQRATQIAMRVENVMTWYNDLIRFKPAVTLLVLSKADWSDYTKMPVYGMPHYNNDSVLIVAAEDNEYWRSFLSMKDLPGEMQKQVKQVYGMPDSSVSLQAFFDLLAIHELGHAFHMQGKLQVQRKWMGELFCNILLHTYIAEKEPGQLPALTLFPKMVVSGGTKNYKYTSLQELEEKYNEIAQQHPQNYGWYQCRWHASAAAIYDADGRTIFQRLWTTFKTEQVNLNDVLLVELLQNKIGKPVADVMLLWETNMVR